MAIVVILAKILGIVLLIFTIRSILKHVKDLRNPEYQKKQHEQALSERLLNGALLYLWLFFCVAFSVGMVLNN
jgi:ABC-type Fe3+ transport system permease subunit